MGLISDAAQSSGDVMRRLRNIEKDMRLLQTARRLVSAAIGSGGVRVHSGGSVRVQDGGSVQLEGGGSVEVQGGDVILRGADGSIQVHLNRTPNGGGQVQIFHPNSRPAFKVGALGYESHGSVGYGYFLQQEDGTDVFGAGPLSPDGPYQVKSNDDDGNVTILTDVGGMGLDRPYMDVPMYTTWSTPGETPWALRVPDMAAQDEWVTLWEGRLWITHPALQAEVFSWAPDGTGEIRLQVDNDTLGTTHEVTSTGSYYDFDTPINLPGSLNHYAFYRVAIQARITTSSGTVLVRPYGITKRGSV